MRFKRERRRTRKEVEGLVYYAFGGQCYHRIALTTSILTDEVFLGSVTGCGREIHHIHKDPQRVWRAAPEAYVRHEYRPCPICYGKNYVYKPGS